MTRIASFGVAWVVACAAYCGGNGPADTPLYLSNPCQWFCLFTQIFCVMADKTTFCNRPQFKRLYSMDGMREGIGKLGIGSHEKVRFLCGAMGCINITGATKISNSVRRKCLCNTCGKRKNVPLCDDKPKHTRVGLRCCCTFHPSSTCLLKCTTQYTTPTRITNRIRMSLNASPQNGSPL